MNEYKLYLDDDLIKTYKYLRCLIKYVNKIKGIVYRRQGIDLTFKVIDSIGNQFFV